jgi:hypothetical protein
MTSVSNKLSNKKKDFFSFNKLSLHKGWWQPNEFKKKIKPFDLIKSCLFYGNIFIFDLFFNVNNSSNGFHKLQGYLDSYNKKSLILIL